MNNKKMNRSKSLLLIGLILVCVVIPLQAQNESSLELVGELSFDRSEAGIGFGVRAIDIWVEGTLAIITAGTVVHLVDVSDLSNPTALSTIELNRGDISWDAKLHNSFAYIGLQATGGNTSVRIYDVSDPTSPELVHNYANDTFAGAHNIFITENVLFIASFSAQGGSLGPFVINQGIWMVDISDPDNPQDIGQLLTDDGEPIPTVHDLTVIENRAYIAGWNSGFWIVDFENLDNPSQLIHSVFRNHAYRGNDFGPPSNHNVWPSEDGNLLWTTDEVLGEFVRVFDISDADNIQLLGEISVRPGSLPHNVMVNGEFAYVSYYRNGLQVLRYDEDAGEIIKVSDFQTAGSTPPSNPFQGAFGLFVLENHVLVSDTVNGLVVLEKGELLNPTNE